MDDDFQLLKQWFASGIHIKTLSDGFRGNTPEYTTYLQLLQLDNENLKPFSKDLLLFLDSNEVTRDLNWSIKAYEQFQDFFGIKYDSNPIENRHYCYYQSLVYLRESLVSIIDKNILASLTLLRPFLELSIMHLYWYLLCESTNYSAYYSWLEDSKNKPAFRIQMDYIVANTSTLEHVEKEHFQSITAKLLKYYKFLCGYHHTPSVTDSVIYFNGGVGEVTLNSLINYFAISYDLVFLVLQLYTFVYPMSFFPVDRFTKWGYQGPVGMTFDKYNSMYIRNAFGPELFDRYQGSFLLSKMVLDWFEWFNSYPDMESSKIVADWEVFIKERRLTNQEQSELLNVKDDFMREQYYKASMRNLKWIINYLDEDAYKRMSLKE